MPGTKRAGAVQSPWRTITLDRVEDVSAQVQLGRARTAILKSRCRSATLGLKPQPGQKFKARLGVLRGNGFQTLQRVYWNNKATGITADVPSEAELTPRLWGRLNSKVKTVPALLAENVACQSPGRRSLSTTNTRLHAWPEHLRRARAGPILKLVQKGDPAETYHARPRQRLLWTVSELSKCVAYSSTYPVRPYFRHLGTDRLFPVQ